eukprot:366539-Chlamydomonas_euryale.AAC.4
MGSRTPESRWGWCREEVGCGGGRGVERSLSAGRLADQEATTKMQRKPGKDAGAAIQDQEAARRRPTKRQPEPDQGTPTHLDVRVQHVVALVGDEQLVGEDEVARAAERRNLRGDLTRVTLLEPVRPSQPVACRLQGHTNGVIVIPTVLVAARVLKHEGPTQQSSCLPNGQFTYGFNA